MHHIIQLANEVALLVHKVPAGFWQALLASGVLAPVLNVYKHLHFTRKEREVEARVMHVAVVAAAFLLSTGQYLLATHPADPRIIALHTAVLGFMTQPVYFFLLKPLLKYAWAPLALKFSEAARLEAELKSATVPPEGLPAAPTTPALTPKEAFERSITVNDNF